MSCGLGDRGESVRTVPPGVGFGNVLLLRFVAFFVRKWSRWIARVMRRGQRRRYPAGDDATRRTRQEEALLRRAMGNPRHREEDCVGETRQAIETPTEAGEETITDAINVTLENHWHQALKPTFPRTGCLKIYLSKGRC